LYYLDVRTALKKQRKSVSTTITTGAVTESEVTGVAGPDVTDAKVKIATKDVKQSKVKGYES
jgi:hypothetical protein